MTARTDAHVDELERLPTQPPFAVRAVRAAGEQPDSSANVAQLLHAFGS